MDAQQRIIHTASYLFIKHGVRSITMDDIAAEAGVSKKTLYEQFINKDDLLTRCLDLLHEEDKTEREKIFNDNSFNIDSMLEMIKESAVRINNINPNFLTDIKKYYPLIWKEKIEKMDDEIINFYTRLINEGIKSGFFRDDINIDVVSKLIHEQMNILMNNDVFPTNKYSRSEVFETIIEVLGRGIINEKLRNELNQKDKNESNKFDMM